MSTLKLSQLSDEDLKKLHNDVYKEICDREDVRINEEIKKLVKKSKLKVRVVLWEGGSDGERYSFYAVKGKKELDSYEDLNEKQREEFMSMIPDGFSEACENSYEYRRGNFDDVVKLFNSLGITDVVKRQANW